MIPIFFANQVALAFDELRFQIYVFLDHGEPLTTFTYNMEGNELLIVFSYSELQTLRNSLNRTYDLCPLVNSFIESAEVTEDDEAFWIERYEIIVAPLRDKFVRRLSEEEPALDVVHYSEKKSMWYCM